MWSGEDDNSRDCNEIDTQNPKPNGDDFGELFDDEKQSHCGNCSICVAACLMWASSSEQCVGACYSLGKCSRDFEGI